MRSLRNLVSTKLFFAVLSILCLIPSVAKAQINNLQGSFSLQHEVRWGKAVLPEGQYSFTIEQEKDSAVYAVVRSSDGKRAVFVQVTASGKPEPGGSYIFIANDGTRRVRLLNLPQQNVSLVFGLMSKREREQLLAVTHDVVPVIVAKN